jgi:hypothetical protein
MAKKLTKAESRALSERTRGDADRLYALAAKAQAELDKRQQPPAR